MAGCDHARDGLARWGEISTRGTIHCTPPRPQDLDMNTNSTSFRELAHRRNDGIDITMVWDSASDQVSVTVNDTKSGEAFEILVAPGERPLDVFHHPFAYAAYRQAAQRPPLLAEAT